MSKDFAAFRLKPDEDDDIIRMLENAENRTDFIKACIRVAEVHIRDCCGDECWDASELEDYIRSVMEV